MGTAANAAEALSELRERVETLRLSAEAAALRDGLRRHEEAARLVEGWGDYVSPLDAWRSEADYFAGGGGGAAGYGPRASRPDDRRDGDNAPFFRSEQELAVIRGAGEWIAQADSTAIGALETLTSYVVGSRAQYDAAAKEENPASETAATDVQRIVDDFLQRVRWRHVLEREIFKRWRRAGEAFVRVYDPDESGVAELEIWEPSWITEPQNARAVEEHWGLPRLDWKYGIASTPGKPSEVWGYYGLANGDPNRGQFLPAAEVVHLKIGDSNVKRGTSDFYPGQPWFEKAAKLLDRVLDGGAIQASIALIRKYGPDVRTSSIRGAADGLVEFDSLLPSAGASGSRSVSAERFYSGKVVDVKGATFEAGPMGQSSAPIYLDIVDAGVAKAARTWGMHKTMVTGDASADTFASALTAESPFTLFCEAVQGVVEAAYSSIFWRVVDLACAAGGLPYDPQQLRTLIDLTCKLPDVAVRDKLEDHQIRAGERQAGVLSLETWCEETGRSYEQEQARIATEPRRPNDAPSEPPFGGRSGERLESDPRIAALAERALQRLIEGT